MSDGSFRKRRTLLRSQRAESDRWSTGSITGRENVSDFKHQQRSLNPQLLHLLVEFRTVTDGSSSTPHIGTVSTSVDINFGTKTIGGGRSFINIDTYKAGGNIQSGFVEIRPVSFNSTGSTYAVFSPAIGSGVPYPSNINAVITLQNANGMVAQNAVCSIAYNNNGSGSYANQGSGSTFGTQSPGLTETPIPPTNSIVSGQ